MAHIMNSQSIICEKLPLFHTPNQCLLSIVLNKPRVLNALDQDMINELFRLFKQVEDNPNIKCVILSSCSEKVFCAGGDIVSVYKSLSSGQKDTDLAVSKNIAEFYRTEYQMLYFIRQMQTPVIAVAAGLVMGGGAGLWSACHYRISTSTTKFAMPETKIGLFPDVGASYFLQNLSMPLAQFVALTGAKLNGAELLETGLASHFRDITAHALIEKLRHTNIESKTGIDDVLTQTPVAACDEVGVLSFAAEITDACDLCSLSNTLKQWSALQNTTEKNALRSVIPVLKQASPLSLVATWQMMQLMKDADLSACIYAEYSLATYLSEHGDFMEGVRALLIDKDNAPVWQHTQVEDIDPSIIINVIQNSKADWLSPHELEKQ